MFVEDECMLSVYKVLCSFW